MFFPVPPPNEGRRPSGDEDENNAAPAPTRARRPARAARHNPWRVRLWALAGAVVGVMSGLLETARILLSDDPSKVLGAVGYACGGAILGGLIGLIVGAITQKQTHR